MPKKRKTRKDKILHDQKRQSVHEETVVASPNEQMQQQKQESTTAGMTFSLPEMQHKTPQVSPKAKPSSQTITVSQNEYSYLNNDLLRTALLTGAIVFAELFIKLFVVR